MVKKVMIPLIAGSAVSVGVVGTAVVVSTTNSLPTNNNSELFASSITSLRKWNILDTQAIAAQSLNIDDSIDSVIEFVYTKQNEFIKNINGSYSVLKATKKDQEKNYISFNVPVQYKDASELDALAKTYFLNNNNWNDVISYCKSKITDIVDTNKIQNMEIVYSVSKDSMDENLVYIKPEQLIVLIQNKEYLIEFLEERSFSSYSLFLGLNNNVSSGTIIEKNQNILRPMILNQETFDCEVFKDLNQETESIIDMIDKVKATNFIYLNRTTIFNNYTYLENKDFISKVVATPIFEKSQINVEISYKNVDITSVFSIQLSDDNLLRFSALSDIHKWENSKREIIELSNTSSVSNDIMLDSTIQLINNTVKKTYMDYPHIDSFIKKIGGENNAFTMELNPNDTFTNSELLQQFPKIFNWLGQAWDTYVNTLGTFPNVNKIKNIIVEFNVQIIGDLKTSNNIDAKIIPVKTTITFNTSTLPNIVWYFSEDLQNEKSYLLSFENTSDNLKIQDTYLDSLYTWATPDKYGIALDSQTTTIGDVTAYITNYIYLRQYDDFGWMPIDTMPQLPSLTDKTNNKFYMNLIGNIVSNDMAESQFKRIWKLKWDEWKQKVKNNAQANRWIPNVDNIANMSVEYQVVELENNLSTGIMKYKVQPISISIMYGYGTNTIWYLSGDLQEKNSYEVVLKKMYKPIAQHILPGQMILI